LLIGLHNAAGILPGIRYTPPLDRVVDPDREIALRGFIETGQLFKGFIANLLVFRGVLLASAAKERCLLEHDGLAFDGMMNGFDFALRLDPEEFRLQHKLTAHVEGAEIAFAFMP